MDGMSSRPMHHSTMRKSNATDVTRVWRGYGTASAWHLNRLQSAWAVRALETLDCSERKVRNVRACRGRRAQSPWSVVGNNFRGYLSPWEPLHARTRPEIAPRGWDSRQLNGSVNKAPALTFFATPQRWHMEGLHNPPRRVGPEFSWGKITMRYAIAIVVARRSGLAVPLRMKSMTSSCTAWCCRRRWREKPCIWRHRWEAFRSGFASTALCREREGISRRTPAPRRGRWWVAAFQGDHEAGEVELTDVKVCEAAGIGLDRLLILERISRTTKIYRVHLAPRFIVGAAHLNDRTRPTLEQSSAEVPHAVPVLAKTLVLSTGDAPGVDRDVEGMIVLSPHELLLVNDNDFSVEGARTCFWRVRLKKSLF